MPVRHIKAGAQVRQLLNEVKEKYHHPRLQMALVALEFVESKPIVKDRVNLGKVTKFSQGTKLWLPENEKYDFLISVCADVWFGMLNDRQREALIDLHLTCCQVEYEPNSVVVNGKKQVIKDEFGRIEYTQNVKTDDEGNPVWKRSPLDIVAFASNVDRYGVWYDDLLELKQAMDAHDEN